MLPRNLNTLLAWGIQRLAGFSKVACKQVYESIWKAIVETASKKVDVDLNKHINSQQAVAASINS